jgi:hypothetical protein
MLAYVCLYVYMYVLVYKRVCMQVRVCVCVCIPFLTVGNGSENMSRCLDFEMVGHDYTLHTHV